MNDNQPQTVCPCCNRPVLIRPSAENAADEKPQVKLWGNALGDTWGRTTRLCMPELSKTYQRLSHLIGCAVFFLLCGSAFAQINQQPHCRIVVNGNTGQDWGSGTLIARTGLVLTCGHIFDDGVGRIQCVFPDGQNCAGRIVSADRPDDLVILALDPTPNIEGVPLGTASGVRRVTVCGWGGCNAGFRASSGNIVASVMPQGARYPSFVVRTPVRNGDSGGGVLDESGRLVGVVWGGDGPDSFISSGESFNQIVATINRGGGQTAPVSLAACHWVQDQYGNMVQVCDRRPPQPQYQQPTYQQPQQRPPLPVAQPATPAMQPCPCGPKWQDLESKLNQLTANLEAQQKFNTEITAALKEQTQTLTAIKNDVSTTINQKFEAYAQEHPGVDPDKLQNQINVAIAAAFQKFEAEHKVPTAAEIAAEVEKNRKPPRLRVVDPQGKFTTEYVTLRDATDNDIIIDQRFTTGAAAAP
jgi:hypothetical protein